MAAAPLTRRPFDVARNLRLLQALAFFTQFNPVIAIWVVYLTDFRDLTLAQVGMMEGLFWAGKLFLEVPSGAFADRYGRRLSNIVGVSVECVGVVAFALASEFWLLALSYVLWSGGLAFRSGNDDAYLYDTLAVGDRTAEYSDRAGLIRALGICAFSGAGVIGGVIAALFTLQVGAISGVATYVVSAVIIAWMQEPPRHTVTVMPESFVDTFRTAWRALRRDPALRWAIALEVAMMAAWPAHFLLAQPFLRQHEVPLALFGVFDVPARLLGAAGMFLSGRWIRRMGMRRGVVACILVTLSGLLVLGSVDHIAAFAGFGLLQLGTGLALPAINAYVNDRTESHVRATILSLSPLGSSLVFGIVGPIVGATGGESLRLAALVMAVVVAVGAGGTFLAWRRADACWRASLEASAAI